MSRSLPRPLVGFVLALVAGATACSLVLGLRDGVDGVPSADGGGGDGGTQDVDPNPLKDVVTVDVDNATCGDAARDYDPTAIHVDPVNGNDGSTCGGPGPGEPCATFKQGLLRIGQTGKKKLYLAPGDYKEQVTLTPGYTGLTIEGGWGPGWKSDCRSSLAQLVDNRSNTAGQTPTMHINDANNVTLRLFTITSRNQGGVGESVSALWVTSSGSAKQVTIDNMTLVARFGGDGPIGVQGNPSFGADCFDGGNGAPGAPGGAGGDGTWGPNGFAAASGAPGNPGATGTAGAPGSPGASGSCVVSCGKFPGCLPSIVATDGTPGQNGCAGGGGFGGGGGGGGGPTAALFVWGSKVDVTGGTTFVTVQGGSGGAGGPGGAGSDGSPGSDGQSTSCGLTCTAIAFDGGGFDGGNAGFCSMSSGTLDGGKGGAAGGKGGQGGQGGGGKGGAAYLVVYGNGATVNVPGAVITQSNNGAAGDGGAPNGAPGERTNVKVLP
jgi:hypothetical protein